MDGFGIENLHVATASLSGGPQNRGGTDLERARASAEDFEAFFIAQSLDLMTKDLEINQMFGGGEAERMYRGILNQEMGKSIAKNGGFGIADMVMQEMIKQQETIG